MLRQALLSAVPGGTGIGFDGNREGEKRGSRPHRVPIPVRHDPRVAAVSTHVAVAHKGDSASQSRFTPIKR